jgi:RNA polymerase sigma-70 factor (ECF subfamily)
MSDCAEHQAGIARRHDSAVEDADLSALLTRCAERDQAALARFYELTSPWIYTLLRRRTRSVTEADDALVTVYTRVWRQAAEFTAQRRSALAWTTWLATQPLT